MNEEHYIVIRMWAPEGACENPELPHFVQMIDPGEGKEFQWTLTRKFEEARLFKFIRGAKRIVSGVERIKSRLDRGWVYEIVLVIEEIVESNIADQKVEAG